MFGGKGSSHEKDDFYHRRRSRKSRRLQIWPSRIQQIQQKSHASVPA